MAEQILICYDGSDHAARAIDAAAALLGERHAVVLNVAPAMTFAEGMAGASSPVPGRMFEDLNEVQALRRAEVGATYARRAGFHAEARASIAPTTWEGIVDVADELDAVAIVVGSRGRSGAHGLPRGSVAHDVARYARRPVLIVPPVTP